jgi:hypothetical protein
MGLDISAYKRLQLLDVKVNEDEEPLDPATGAVLEDYTRVYIEEVFAERAEDLVNGGFYTYADRMGFRAGSYSGYSEWRDTLAKIAGYLPVPYNRFGKSEMRHDAAAWNATGGPFWELINFSDSEGSIGAKVSTKLLDDFRQYLPQARSEGDAFLEKYISWMKAFELAADSGAVRFH